MPSPFVSKLSESGLSTRDAKALGIELLTKTQFAKLLPRSTPPVPAMKLNYYDVTGKKRAKVWRVRVLAPQVGAFGAVSSVRYLQSAGTPPAAYFVRGMKWKQIAQDTDATIVITEGELKAACACKHGLNCIGLGGVWSWKSKERGWSLLPELSSFQWAGRDVVICFDSDAATNPQVAAAAAALCNELRARGARTAIAALPSIGDGKTGLDDFIVARGIDALKCVLEAAEDDELALKLWEYNGRFAYVVEPDIIYDELKNMQLNPHRAATSALANETAVKVVGDKRQRVLVVKEWLAWPHRRTLDRFTYVPGGPRVVGDDYNQWRGWGVEEKKGDMRLWHELLAYLMQGATVDERVWFERWLAYPIQHPGAKMMTACCFWSHAQGIGKSLTALLVGDVYGDNFSEIQQAEFEASFTQWGVGKQFVLVDDVSNVGIKEKRDHAARLKTLITQQLFKVNIKYIANYTLPDRINYMLTSNSPDALLIDETDRRFFIHHCPEEPKPKAWYDKLDAWRHGDGPAALLYYLRRLDLGDQDHNTRPPENRDKEEMSRATRTDHEQWAIDLREQPDEKLTFGAVKLKGDIYQSNELYTLFVRENGNRLSRTAFGIALTKAGFERRVIKVGDSAKRLIAVRNRKRWDKQSAAAWAKHYTQNNEAGWAK